MVSEQDFERLSAYIDDELSPADRVDLESRLQQDPSLRDELRELQIMVRAVRQLPRPVRQRDFTLMPSMIAPPRPARFLMFPATTTYAALSAAAAFLLVSLGTLLLLASGSGNLSMSPSAAENQVALQLTSPVQVTILPSVTSTRNEIAAEEAAPQNGLFSAEANGGAESVAPDDTDDARSDEEAEEEAPSQLRSMPGAASDPAADSAPAAVGALGADGNAPPVPAAMENTGALNDQDTEVDRAAVAESADDAVTVDEEGADEAAADTFNFEAGDVAVPQAESDADTIESAGEASGGGAVFAVPTAVEEIAVAPTAIVQPALTASPAVVADAPPADIADAAEPQQTVPPARSRVAPSTPVQQIAAVLLLFLGGLFIVATVGILIRRRRTRRGPS